MTDTTPEQPAIDVADLVPSLDPTFPPTAHTRYPRTCHALAYFGIHPGYVLEDDSFHDDGYDSLSMTAAGQRAIDPKTKKVLRIRTTWPTDNAKTVIEAAFAEDKAPTGEYIDWVKAFPKLVAA
ncbi:hypothetical protein [Pseudolysinimonas sp.]|uniref:hypothetical protein n=1 Tax=Pseudolysinimonas sp. TaxID=2680009 RepID=UPI003F7D44A8